MELFGIGVPELVFIVVIALIVLGPKDMAAAGENLGKGLRKFITSPAGKAIRGLQGLPTQWMREAGFDELDAMGKEVANIGGVIDARRAPRSFPEKRIPGVSDSPSPAPTVETDSPSEPNPGPESSSENPQT